MRNKEFIPPRKNYFAAANGYSGFRSYFNVIFNPREYTRIFVLKGGPGTGKSTLMKRLCARFQVMGYDGEAIFCSSDPNSLDGVIVGKGDRRIAVIDGTAPHEVDARIPGAIDEIVNLGDMWSVESLIKRREEILALNDEKRAHYSSAYELLRIAGCISEYKNKIVRRAYKENDQHFVNDIFYDIQDIKRGRKEEIKLISSFGKSGYKALDVRNFSDKGGISVSGVYGSEFIFMESVRLEAERRGTPHTRFPSPYSDSMTEAIYLYESDTLIIASLAFDNVIDSSQFLDSGIISKNEDKLAFLDGNHREVLELSRREFEKASDRHFDLEAIYSPAMDFRRIDTVLERLTDKIANYLEH